MAPFSFELKRRKLRFERIDNVVCVGILLAASMPAIVVMLLLAFPLLPLLAMCLCVGASSAPSFEPSSKEAEAGGTSDAGSSDRTIAATPHYA